MDTRFPLRVVVMDDDYYALKGVVGLLSRDLRTLVVAECDSAESLIQTIASHQTQPDIILIDAEYIQAAISLEQLIHQAKAHAPNATLICWSQYGQPAKMRNAVRAGADAILIKKEVRLSIATSLVQTFRAKTAYTPSVTEILGDAFNDWVQQGERLEPWQPHPDLSPRLKQVFWYCMVYGMSVRAAAAEMHVQPETVERYRMKIYDIMGDGWVDDAYLREAEDHISEIHGKVPRSIDWAFHMITQPPRKKDE